MKLKSFLHPSWKVGVTQFFPFLTILSLCMSIKNIFYCLFYHSSCFFSLSSPPPPSPILSLPWVNSHVVVPVNGLVVNVLQLIPSSSSILPLPPPPPMSFPATMPFYFYALYFRWFKLITTSSVALSAYHTSFITSSLPKVCYFPN